MLMFIVFDDLNVIPHSILTIIFLPYKFNTSRFFKYLELQNIAQHPSSPNFKLSN